MSITLDHLVSHRFRGFAPVENSLQGLRNALSFGVKHLEFDIRLSMCGTPMIYHDEYAFDGAGKKRKLCDMMAKDFETAGGDFKHMPSFEQLLKTVIGSGNKTSQLLIDIKDAGFEEAIIALVRLYRLQDRATYVSWLPDALYKCHALDPEARLCLSHWCKNPDSAIRAKHAVFTSYKGRVPASKRRYIHGERAGWFIDGILSGDMLSMLQKTGGSICVPVNMVSAERVKAYHDHGIVVSVFSYTDMKDALKHQAEMDIDLFFVDDRAVFDAL